LSGELWFAVDVNLLRGLCDENIKKHTSECIVQAVFVSVHSFRYLRTVYDQVFGLEAHPAALNIL
jgi:hypothetical protein